MAEAKKPSFESEKDMCAAFMCAIDRRKQADFTIYPETGGFDMLMVRKEDGFQIGVEAKLRLNAKVVSQSLPGKWTGGSVGPDCRAVLVPYERCGGDFVDICNYIGITIITIRQKPVPSWARIDEEAPPAINFQISPKPPELEASHNFMFSERWYEWAPDFRITLPPVVPDCAAGCPSPLMLTDWKIKAIKIVILLEKFGSITRADFEAIGVNSQRWTSGTGWLNAAGKIGRITSYVAGPNLPDFRCQHPKNYDEIESLIGDWMPKERLGV